MVLGIHYQGHPTPWHHQNLARVLRFRYLLVLAGWGGWLGWLIGQFSGGFTWGWVWVWVWFGFGFGVGLGLGLVWWVGLGLVWVWFGLVGGFVVFGQHRPAPASTGQPHRET